MAAAGIILGLAGLTAARHDEERRVGQAAGGA